MPTLREIQFRFVRALKEKRDDALSAYFVGDNDLVQRRLNVYRNNVALTQRAALAAIYPVIEALIGEVCFTQCAAAYLALHPSRNGDLNALGADFPGFVHQYDATRSLDYLQDVARLEWAYHRAFHAYDEPNLLIQTLSAVPADRYDELRFHLHISTTLLASPYPILKIWQAHLPDAKEANIRLDDGGIRLLVARVDLDVEFVPLDIGAYTFLNGLVNGQTLGSAYQDALAHDSEFDFPRAFPFFVQSGFISRIRI